MIALDAGQSSVTARRLDWVGGVVELPPVRTDRSLLPQLAEAATAAMGVLGPAEGIAIGATGLSEADADVAGLLGYLGSFGVESVVLAHDSITSYLGAIGEVSGVVTAVGTGVVTLGVGASAVARVDGWGNIIGDAGSAYWIGRAALESVMRAFDGRGPDTALRPVIEADFPRLEGAYLELQSDADRVRRIAAYAKHVDGLSSEDAVARRICREAAAELVLSVATALRRVDEADSVAPRICAIGGVLSSSVISSDFDRGIRESWPRADLAPAIGSGLDGAALLHDLPDEHVLTSETWRATRTGQRVTRAR